MPRLVKAREPRVISPESAALGFNNAGRGKLIGYITDKKKHSARCKYVLGSGTCSCTVGLWQEPKK